MSNNILTVRNSSTIIIYYLSLTLEIILIQFQYLTSITYP